MKVVCVDNMIHDLQAVKNVKDVCLVSRDKIALYMDIK